MSDAPPDSGSRESSPEVSRGGWRRLRQHAGLRRFLLRWVSLRQPVTRNLLGLPVSRSETGWLGECLAVKHLHQEGRRVLYRNYRGQHRGEVDIVARHGEALTFVEVKTRRSAAFGRPADAVTPDKQRLIQRGAQDWLRLLGHPRITIRFDIVEVLLIDGEQPTINILENAFTLPDNSMAGR